MINFLKTDTIYLERNRLNNSNSRYKKQILKLKHHDYQGNTIFF